MATFRVVLSTSTEAFTDQVSNIYDAPIWFGDVISTNEDRLILVGTNGFGARYNGSFTFKNGVLAEGMVNSFALYVEANQGIYEEWGGNAQYRIDDLNGTKGLSAKKLLKYAQNGDSQSALKYMMSKDDMLYGSGFDNKPTDETLYGWGGKDTIFGLAGDDVIGGGTGKDKLYGGNGADYFFFDSSLSKDADTIEDVGFGGTRDKIVLLVSAFNTIDLGSLAAESFVIGTAAVDDDDRIVVNGNRIFYDRDGSGLSKPTLIATVKYAEVDPDATNLIGISQLEASDFLVVESLQSLG